MSEIHITSSARLERAVQRVPRLGRPLMRIDRILTNLVSHLILAIFTIVIVYPVSWMVFSSLKTQGEIVANVWGLPRSLAWENYTEAWRIAMLGTALFSSLVTSAGTTALVIALAALAGYAFARMQFRFSSMIFLTFVFTMQTGAPVIPLYVLLVKMHMTDSYPGLILPMVASGLPLSIFIFRAFFRSIPQELMDAARVDGCGEFGTLLRVVMPIAGPAVATVAILQFLGAWNEYFLSLVLIRSPAKRTIPLAIQSFFYEQGRSEWAYVFAALCVGSLPMIILYVIMQRRFIQGLTQGAVKG